MTQYTGLQCLEKRDQSVFFNISYETRVILIKFGTSFYE